VHKIDVIFYQTTENRLPGFAEKEKHFNGIAPFAGIKARIGHFLSVPSSF
jgi:hypothetical protein